MQDNYKLERRVEVAAYLSVSLGVVNIIILMFIAMITLHGGI